MAQNLRPSFFLSSSVVRLHSLLPCEVPTRTRPPSCRPMLKLELCSTGKRMGRHVILFSVWGFRLAFWCFDSAACSVLLFLNPSFFEMGWHHFKKTMQALDERLSWLLVKSTCSFLLSFLLKFRSDLYTPKQYLQSVTMRWKLYLLYVYCIAICILAAAKSNVNQPIDFTN